ncbi:helix-turn-helix domain-containing protein [Arcobacter lacus]|uniref:helix-turn-helix transcriptional regulator n=1 Tax=Arcobacter lacus TaxID=1912876 RepID=UPI0021BAABFE|nr:helix-turn-helix domain-containing protein [Arcobacter lacus]MCT7910685.1 helix-turn-helix domain-containing protein [Arcobacter lacus]
MNENLLTKEELAVRLNLSVHRIDKLRKNNNLPCKKLAKKIIRYDLNEVNEFLKEYGKENAK